MIVETDKKEFFKNYAKTTGVVLTSLIADCNNFNGRVYIDNQDRYYLSINYGAGEIITVFQLYSIDLYNDILNQFPDTVSIDFIYNGYIKNESINDITNNLNYDYKFQGILNSEIKTNQPFKVKLITENDIELLNQYDDLYLNFLPPHHMARLANNFKYIAEAKKFDEHKIYIAYIENVPIGFILAYFFPEYFAWSFATIEIAKDYQQKGYGAAFLTEVTKENFKPEYNLYYTGVSADNIASRKTAEKSGYIIATSRMSVNVKKEGEQTK